MKNTGFKKSLAIMDLKIKMLLRNTSAMTGPLMAIGMTLLMRVLYSSMAEGNLEMMDSLLGMALNLGLSFNIGMGAVMMTALPLAEDKEKFTLRSLMTSSVNSKQFFIGSLMPPFIIAVITNYVLIFVSGVNIANFDMGMYTLVSVTGTLISCMLGLLIGIIAKSQVHANNLMMPFIMILSLLPTFAAFNDSVRSVSNYIYTGMLANMMTAFNEGSAYILNIGQMSILLVSVIVISILFMYFYKKNLLETD